MTRILTVDAYGPPIHGIDNAVLFHVNHMGQESFKFVFEEEDLELHHKAGILDGQLDGWLTIYSHRVAQPQSVDDRDMPCQ